MNFERTLRDLILFDFLLYFAYIYVHLHSIFLFRHRFFFYNMDSVPSCQIFAFVLNNRYGEFKLEVGSAFSMKVYF